jgi:hypothetical protein
MRPLFAAVFVVSAVTLGSFPSPARAQSGDTGSILGSAFDQAGMPLKGVKITIRSDTQIGGARSTYTNEEGGFRFPALQPGRFELRASAPKLKQVIVKSIPVGISAPAEVNVVLDVETATEEVSIIERPPLVNTKSAAMKETIDLEMISAMPLDDPDNPHRGLLGAVAGTMGASNSANGRVRGGLANQTIFTQDGFDLQEQYPTMKTSAAYEVLTGGHGGESPLASGAAVNLVTRSGSNKFEVEMRASFDNSRLRFFLDENEAGQPNYKYIFNPTVSGPILRDRLWFFVNNEVNLDRDARSADPAGIYPDRPDAFKLINKGTFKLTWQVSPRNRLSSINNWEAPIIEYNRRDDFGVDPAAQERREARRLFSGLIWESLLSDNAVLRSQVGLTYYGERIMPELCITDPQICDSVHQVKQETPRDQWYGNNDEHTVHESVDLQFSNRFEYFIDSKILGEHALSLRSAFFTEQDVTHQSTPGDRVELLRGDDRISQQTFYSNDPRNEPEHFGWYIQAVSWQRHIATVTDSWRVTRYLTINPALSHIWGRSGSNIGVQAMNTSAFTPSVAAIWDPSHDGRSALRAAYSNYADLAIEELARHNIGGRVSKTCDYNATTGEYDRNCTWGGGFSRNTIGLPCGPTGVDALGRSCREQLRIPRTHEFTLGGEREVVPGIALALDGVYKKFTRQYARRETNRVWNPSGTALDRTGGFRNGRNQTITDLTTPDFNNRRYMGATLALRKREGRLKAQAAYTLSELRGAADDYGENPGQDVYLYGYLGDDHRHEIRTMATFQTFNWLSNGVRFTYVSGTPYNRNYFNSLRTSTNDGYTDRRARLGYNPGVNINDPFDDRESRLPDVYSVNLQTRINMRPLIGQQLEFYIDILNVLAMRTTTGVTQNEGPNYGRPSSRQGPMRMRLGLIYRY